MMFQEADKAAAAGAVADPAADPEKSAESADAPAAVDYKATLLKLLGLDASADDAAIQAKAAEVQGTLTKVPDLETAAAGANDAAEKLRLANEETERVRGEYQVLFERDQAAQKAKQEAEVDAILEQYADRLTDEKAKARIRSILVSDREAGMEILNGLPAAAAAPSTTGEEKKAKEPPAPKHDPAAESEQASANERADKISARAREIVKNSNPKVSLTKAYQMAESELDNAA
jgi:hypothetical protein